jgi:hypothetical protein
VGGDQRVCFSQGNLQYLPAANLWKFADQQYQTLAHSNKYASIIYRNWIDLFGYSTDNLSTPFGVSTTTLSAHYAGKFIDWGTNPICGDMPGTWRTLGLDEWDYLLNKRTDAKKLRSLAQIEGINGLTISNAMHLSAWLGKPIDIATFDHELFYEELSKRIKNSKRNTNVREATASDMGASFK